MARTGSSAQSVARCPNRGWPGDVSVRAAHRAATKYEPGGVMSEYLLLLYTEETDEAGMAERLSEMPVWN
ncbi:MAG TPA: hypothetical protein VEL02_06110, partial [Jatrophihabitantaceae bacterium]|nr:hypothetical protein [Jatrophihabitantaceae bacterium]